MTKTVVLAGALDTKGQEFAFVKKLIEQAGLQTLVVDFGVMSDPTLTPDISREEVAQAGGRDPAKLDDALGVARAAITEALGS